MSNEFSNDWVFNFGKYIGKTIDQVSDFDPDYLGYCLDEIDWFGMQDKALAEQCLEMYLEKDFREDDTALPELDFD